MIQTGSVTLNGTEVPVFSSDDIGEKVNSSVRVSDGVIPLVQPSRAAFPHIRISTGDNRILSPHNSPEVLEYFITPGLVEDWESGSTSKWTKQRGRQEDTLTITKEPTYSGQYAGKVTNRPSGSTPSFITEVGEFTRGTSVGAFVFLTGTKPAFSIRMWDNTTADALMIRARNQDGSTYIQFSRGGSLEVSENISYSPSNFINRWNFAEVVWNTDKTISANIYDRIPLAYPNGTSEASLLKSYNSNTVIESFEPKHIMIHAQGKDDRVGSCTFDDISVAINRSVE